MKAIFSKISPRMYIALSGILLGITVIFADVGIFAYFALIPLAFALIRRLNGGEYRGRKAYLDGFIFYMCFDIVGFHWFTYFYPLEFSGLNPFEVIIVIFLAWIGLSALQSVFSAFVFVLISRFARTDVYKKYPILLAPFTAALFAINEWTQTFTWAGVPWTRIAISQTEMPVLMQSASLFGSYFLTFLVVLINFLLAFALFCADKKKIAAFAAAGVFLLNTAVGSVLYFIPNADTERELKFASIQGNLPSQSSDETFSEIYSIYEEQTVEAVKAGADIVIWPEGVFPGNVDSYIYVNGSGYITLKKAVSKLSVREGVTIVIGCYTYNESDEAFNSISAFYPDGSMDIGAYAKIRVVPFGEYLPLRDLIEAVVPPLAQINLFAEDVHFGTEFNVFGATSKEDAIKIGSLICFDSIYEEIGIGSARNGAELFIIPSNDSWFYDSRALNMHHAQNILRAVEQGRYTVNCGNTGMTSILNDKGEVVSSMPIFTRGYVLDTVYASSHRTLYSYIGNLFVYLMVALVVSTLAYDRIKRLKNKKS